MLASSLLGVCITFALCCSSNFCHSGFGHWDYFRFVWSRNWSSVALLETRMKLENSSKLIRALPSTSIRLIIAYTSLFCIWISWLYKNYWMLSKWRKPSLLWSIASNAALTEKSGYLNRSRIINCTRFCKSISVWIRLPSVFSINSDRLSNLPALVYGLLWTSILSLVHSQGRIIYKNSLKLMLPSFRLSKNLNSFEQSPIPTPRIFLSFRKLTKSSALMRSLPDLSSLQKAVYGLKDKSLASDCLWCSMRISVSEIMSSSCLSR